MAEGVGEMIEGITFATSTDIDARDLSAFYKRQHHSTTTDPAKLQRMISQTFCFVTARQGGQLIGIARGVADGVRGHLVECKLDPRFQGPACVTRTDGRIEHDTSGVAREMALRVVQALKDYGVDKIHVMAYGTEVDFCEDLGFKRISGMVALELVLHPPDRTPAEGASE